MRNRVTTRVALLLGHSFRIITLCLVMGMTAACSQGIDLGPQSDQDVGPHFTPVTNPFPGRTLYVSDDLQAARWAKANRGATWLAPITSRSQARWVNSTGDLPSLHRAALRAAAAHDLLVAVSYAIPNRGCDYFKEGAPTAPEYETYIRGLISALSPAAAVIILEPDSVAADCWTSARAQSLRWATHQLTTAGHHVYIDAGHAGWRSTGLMAARLLQAGITEASGFAINVSARDTLAQARAYGEELSDLVGARPYVIDTSRDGVGPAQDEGAHASWCNPQRQALGGSPSTVVVRHNVAQLWIKNPGESDGNGPTCGGETAYPGLFSPRQARSLIAGAAWVTAADRRALPDPTSLPLTK